MFLRQGNDRGTQYRSAIYTFDCAEDSHQQYPAKNPNGYCGLGGTGVSWPIGVARVE